MFESIANFFNKPKPPSALSGMYTPPPIPPTYHLPDRGVKVTDADIEAFKPLLYGEVSNRKFPKKQLEADVILNTALNRQAEYAKRGKEKTVAEILAMPNQYQAYGGPQYQEYASTTNPVSAAKKKEVDTIVESIRERIRRGDYKDTTQGSYFYIHNPDKTITYDNKKPLFAK
jgi:hypothetical protein